MEYRFDHIATSICIIPAAMWPPVQEKVALVLARSANACPELRCPLRTATSDNPITTITRFQLTRLASLSPVANIVGDGAGDPKQVGIGIARLQCMSA